MILGLLSYMVGTTRMFWSRRFFDSVFLPLFPH